MTAGVHPVCGSRTVCFTLDPHCKSCISVDLDTFGHGVAYQQPSGEQVPYPSDMHAALVSVSPIPALTFELRWLQTGAYDALGTIRATYLGLGDIQSPYEANVWHSTLLQGMLEDDSIEYIGITLSRLNELLRSAGHPNPPHATCPT